MVNQEVLKYLNTIIGKPIKIGETDCNTITAKILDIIHGSDVHEELTSQISRNVIRSARASEVLEDLGYNIVEDKPSINDFILIPERFWDSCMFMFNSTSVVSAMPRKLDNKGKTVKAMKLRSIPEGGQVWRLSHQ